MAMLNKVFAIVTDYDIRLAIPSILQLIGLAFILLGGLHTTYFALKHHRNRKYLLKDISLSKYDKYYYQVWLLIRRLSLRFFGILIIGLVFLTWGYVIDELVKMKISILLAAFLSFCCFLTLFIFWHIFYQHDAIIPSKLLGLSGKWKPGLNIDVNDDIDSAKAFALNVILPEVKREILIVSGGLDPFFYGDHRIFEALARMKQKGVAIEIIFGSPENNVPTEVQKKVYDVIGKFDERNMIDALRVVEKAPLKHFAITDGKNIRLEEYHPPWYEDHQARHTAVYYRNNADLARIMRVKYEEIRSRSRALDYKKGSK